MASDLLNSTTAITKATLVLPTTPEECYAYVRSLQLGLETANAVTYWHIGAAVQSLKDMNIEKPEEAMAREANIKDRLVRYCRQTYEAFEAEELKQLCRKGLQWSTVRELASDSVAPFRKTLLDRFMEDRYTDLEVRDLAIKIRSGTALSVLVSEDGTIIQAAESDESGGTGEEPDVRKRFTTSRKKVCTLAKNLAEEAAAFSDQLVTDFADVVVKNDGSGDDPEVIEELAAIETEVQRVLAEAISLVRATHLMSARADYPFDNLDSMLQQIRQEFLTDAPTEAAVAAKEE